MVNAAGQRPPVERQARVLLHRPETLRLLAPPKVQVTRKGKDFEWTQDQEAARAVQLKTLTK